MPARLLLAAVLAVGAAQADMPAEVVMSPAPDHVALTVYRAPDGRGAIDLGYLRGFALVTETRRIHLPRGPAVIRFAGVADGIVPVSAIVDGLPGGTIEKNRDARLLSPAALVDGTLGRQVTLTRTDRATGHTTSEDATIVAGPTPGVILRTTAGIEALRCSGLPERTLFDGVPAGLSNRPVLSVATRSPVDRIVTVRLSYLASGFDWRASYVATLARDGRTLGLFGWLTLANGNPERFPDADVQAVAGRLNRVAIRALPREAAALRLVCYPLGTTTSDLQPSNAADDIVVTGSRMMISRMGVVSVSAASPPALPAPPPPEDLGDLKLYRVPRPTTVAARAQKQLALLSQPSVRFERRYRRPVGTGETLTGATTTIVLVLKNEARAGLGVPLPAGDTALYAARGGARLLLGLGATTDRTVGETLRLAAGVSRQVLVTQATVSDGEAVLTVQNANAMPVALDLPIGVAGQQIETQSTTTRRIDGIVTWSPVLPPHGRAELRYSY